MEMARRGERSGESERERQREEMMTIVRRGSSGVPHPSDRRSLLRTKGTRKTLRMRMTMRGQES